MIAEPSHPLVERARRLAPSLVAHRAAHDQARQLTPEAVASLREQGLLAALVPTELGGHQLAAPVYVELLEEVARGR
ncbi:MAG TPA: acyl-CoA dehydrogenase family protein [Kofleriaceae bacterium]|nr:acyl-CoA dehydrogenase family protein [Kofleriaceae bacterium]